MRLAYRLTTTLTLLVSIIVVFMFAVVAWREPGSEKMGLAVLTGLTIVLLAAANSYVANSLSRSVEELSNTATEIANGNYAPRAFPESDTELGDLAQALERLRAQAELSAHALRAEEGLQAAVTETLNEGVVVVNASQQVVRINDTARQLLRLKVAVPFSTDFLPRDRTLRDLLSTALQGRDSTPGEARLDDRTLSATARPLVDGGAVIALYDLTPFRKLEAVRRDFVANVSHELRTPLTIISGFIETLEDDDIPLELRKQFLGMASGNVRRMQRIVDDLLDLSRIESGGWLPDPIEMELQPLVNEIISALRATYSRNESQLESAIDEDARVAYVDSTAVRQILTNLAENALRHTTHGSVTLFAERREKGVWIGVRDTGSGIGAEHLGRIFERFYRADPSRSREAGGTGLGLSIVKHLVDVHGGRVRAESVLGRGTTIAAWFPDAE